MRFDQYQPCERLRQYVRHFVISENEDAQTYKIFPSTNLVVGFQYRGSLSVLKVDGAEELHAAGITGLSDQYKVFRNTPGIGTVLVMFSEMGFAHFSKTPAHELFGKSISLFDLFSKDKITETEERLALASDDRERIEVIERFLLEHLRELENDKLIADALRLIEASRGTIRIATLARELATSQSPLEKRFRARVGTSPKKFASIVRFNHILASMDGSLPVSDLLYETHFFDQAHFIREFKRFTGQPPETFRRNQDAGE